VTTSKKTRNQVQKQVQRQLQEYMDRKEDKKFKIGVMGTHDTGKTTFVYGLLSALKSAHSLFVGVVTEKIRECPFESNEMTSFRAQYWTLNQQINAEIVEHTRYNVLVCDRTVIDNFAYCVRASRHKDEKGRPRINKEELTMLKQKCQHWAKTYDYLFLTTIPIRKKMENDGFRSTSKRFQMEIDEILKEIIEEWKLDEKVTVVYGNNEKRIDIALNKLAEILL